LLTPGTESPEYRLELARGSQRAEVRVAPKLTVNDPAVLHGACAAGLGVALLPEFLCRQGLATGRLKLVLPDWTLAPAADALCRLCGNPRSGRAGAALRRVPGGEHRAGARIRASRAGAFSVRFALDVRRLDVSRTDPGASLRTG
jgi:DNA-binding transcriptional LysR family regulator